MTSQYSPLPIEPITLYEVPAPLLTFSVELAVQRANFLPVEGSGTGAGAGAGTGNPFNEMELDQPTKEMKYHSFGIPVYTVGVIR